MPNKPPKPITIPADLYEGRNFAPAIETTRKHGDGPVDTPGRDDGKDELLSITVVAPAKGGRINIAANINPATWPTDHQHGLRCITAITKASGDFTFNAREGLGGSLQAAVGEDVKGLPRVEAGETVVINVTPTERGLKGIGMRVNVTITEK